jgi:cation transport ATPase
MALALFGDGLLKIMGIFCNVEMADMFENPLGTINIRLFWSHWNRAIATVLHRVVFGGGRNTKSSVKTMKKQKAEAAQDKRTQALRNRKHLDHLSETEHETSKTDDEDDDRRKKARSNGLKMTSSKPSEANGNAKSNSPEKPKSQKSFLPKAAAAIATFGMSGIFHEHITYNTLGYADGSNLLFFLLNGLATVTSTWFKRTFPKANAQIPTLVSVLLLHAFFLAVIPLFCTPFIKKGFFTRE